MTEKAQPRFDITLAGEINLDVLLYGLPENIPLERELLASGCCVTLGSSSAITAHNLSMLGSKVGFITRVGRDDFGTMAIRRLNDAGVDLSRVTESPSLNTGVTMDGLAALVSNGGAGYSFTDSALTNWLATANTATVAWTIFANDQFGAQRGLTTTNGSNGTTTLTNGLARAANGNNSAWIDLNLNLAAFNTAGVTEQVAANTSAAYIGASSLALGQTGYGYNFNSNGSLANSDYAAGMNVISINTPNATTAKSTYAVVGTPVAAHAWMAGNTFNIGTVAAVPEADSLAMLLAGMGLVGSIARRRARKTA